jgi:hypothetical protein
MDIGQPKRIIEIVPATLPVPGEIPGQVEPAAPEHEPSAPAPSEPAEQPAG